MTPKAYDYLLTVTHERMRMVGREQVEKGHMVKVHCTGTLQNGTKFWCSKDPDQDAFEFTVGEKRVIKGWDEGVIGMRQGEVAVLTIPPESAYGSQGFSAWGENNLSICHAQTNPQSSGAHRMLPAKSDAGVRPLNRPIGA